MNVKRIVKKMVRSIGSKSIGFKIALVGSIAVVSVSVFTIPKLFDQTHSAYESHAIVDSITKNALFDLEVSKLDGIQVSNLVGVGGATFTASGVADGVSLGKTTLKDGNTSFGTLLNIDKLAPKDVFAYGYKCQNVGNIPMTLYLDLKSTYTKPAEATGDLAYLGQDPRARFDLKIYEGDAVTGTYNLISDGVLNLSMYDTQAAVPLLPNTRNLDPTQAKYYIVVIEFTDSAAAWTSNNTGDNVYQLAETGLDLTIKAKQKN